MEIEKGVGGVKRESKKLVPKFFIWEQSSRSTLLAKKVDLIFFGELDFFNIGVFMVGKNLKASRLIHVINFKPMNE